jgi:hypothetical protein
MQHRIVCSEIPPKIISLLCEEKIKWHDLGTLKKIMRGFIGHYLISK